MNLQDKLIIGILGCGIWGIKILKELVLIQEAEIWVYDPDLSKQTAIIEAGASRILSDFLELSNADGIIVASPATTHFGVLQELIPYNIPIFVEKPLTTDLKEAKALLRISHEKIFMMHIWRYHKGVKLLAEIAASGELGKILSLKTTRTNWTSPRKDTDAVWTLLPHDLSIALEIFGEIPEPRLAVSELHKGIPRSMIAIFGEEPFMFVEASNRYLDKRREIRLQGTLGTAVLKDEMIDYIEIVKGDANSRPEEVVIEKRKFDNISPLKLELEAFIGYLKGGAVPVSDLKEGVEVIRIIQQLRELANI